LRIDELPRRLRRAQEGALHPIDARVSPPDCCGPGQGQEDLSHGKEKLGHAYISRREAVP
jgi:hypothetical protein